MKATTILLAYVSAAGTVFLGGTQLVSPVSAFSTAGRMTPILGHKKRTTKTHRHSRPTIHLYEEAIAAQHEEATGFETSIEEQSVISTHPKYMQEIPKLGTIMKMLPKESFQVSTKESLLYFGLDLAAVVTCLSSLHMVVTSDLYHSLAMWQQAIMVAPLQVLSGFAMWCMWCIGHDAGHTTVSKKYPWINRLVGEVAHSVICLTPFIPWAKSHLKHHLNHNHIDRDYSHQWFIREEKDELHPLFLAAYELRNLQLPFLYLVYLLIGIPDGGHVVFYGRMWQKESLKEKINASWSVMVSIATAGWLWSTMGMADFLVVCMVPWLVTSFWLFMVTYLQHHSDDGVLYTDDTWDFTRGAFETVDRSYGGNAEHKKQQWLDVDRLSHHMMDGHVVHHLFFTKIPHYRLKGATQALQAGLEQEGLGHLYKNVDTPNFTQEIVRQFHNNWFFVNEDQVVRENQEKESKLEYQKKFN